MKERRLVSDDPDPDPDAPGTAPGTARGEVVIDNGEVPRVRLRGEESGEGGCEIVSGIEWWGKEDGGCSSVVVVGLDPWSLSPPGLLLLSVSVSVEETME
jgi:hypothetical protein